MKLTFGNISPALRDYQYLLSVALLLTVLTSGCIVVPTPEFNSGEARRNITKETPYRFEPGKTTRTDVILALGEPDAVSPDEFKLAYRSCKVRAWGSFADGSNGPITKDIYLVMQFDGNGVFQKWESSSRWIIPSDAQLMLSPVSTTYQKSIRLQNTADWLPDVDGYKDFSYWGVPEENRVWGLLILTDTELEFITREQFANTNPELMLSFEEINEVGTDKLFGPPRRLVVRTKAGRSHSFEIITGFFYDKEAMQSIIEFLQTKIKH
jgi:hypothetical protein